MPAFDLYHNAVKQALIKEGWTIIADPYRIQFQELDLYADLAAELPIAANVKGKKLWFKLRVL